MAIRRGTSDGKINVAVAGGYHHFSQLTNTNDAVITSQYKPGATSNFVISNPGSGDIVFGIGGNNADVEIPRAQTRLSYRENPYISVKTPC